MTRKQVAVRLGKSLATVRRLEGVRLHPVRDAQGVHRFDPDEVEDLVDDVRNGNVSLADEMRPAAVEFGHSRRCAYCDNLGRELAAARKELDERQAKHARELAAARKELDERQAKHARELAALRNEHQAESARFEASTATLVGEMEDLLRALEA
jgi:hypothetical protein